MLQATEQARAFENTAEADTGDGFDPGRKHCFDESRSAVRYIRTHRLERVRQELLTLFGRTPIDVSDPNQQEMLVLKRQRWISYARVRSISRF